MSNNSHSHTVCCIYLCTHQHGNLVSAILTIVSFVTGSSQKPAPDGVVTQELQPSSDEDGDEMSQWESEIEVVRTAYEAPEPPAPMEAYFSVNEDGSLPGNDWYIPVEGTYV